MFKTTLKKKSSINIIPMIDVIFFLLIFFMLFTTFRSNPTGIDLKLPKAVTVTEQQSKNMIIDINAAGEIFYRGKKTSLSNLMEVAKIKYDENREIVVIINADREVRYKHIIAVMDSLRQVGIYKLALAAEKKE